MLLSFRKILASKYRKNDEIIFKVSKSPIDLSFLAVFY